jgi:hypothetical protein
MNDQDVIHPIQGLSMINPMKVPCLKTFREALIRVVGTTGHTAETVVTTIIVVVLRVLIATEDHPGDHVVAVPLTGHRTKDKALREEADAVRSPAIHELSVELQTQKNNVTASPAPITSTTT